MKKSIFLGLFFIVFSVGIVQAPFWGPVTDKEWATLAHCSAVFRQGRDTAGDDEFIEYLRAKYKERNERLAEERRLQTELDKLASQ